MNIATIKKGLSEFVEYPKKVVSAYGGGIYVWRLDMVWCLLKYGARPIDYYRFGFYRLNRYERKRYMTFYKYLKLSKKSIANGAIMADKVQEYQRYSEYINRKWIYVPEASDNELIEFINQYSPLIAKPNGGEQGKGVFTIKAKTFKNAEIANLRGNKYILEEKLVNCEELALINPSSLNTLRVYTMLDSAGDPHILTMMLRVGKTVSDVDNWGAGGVGYEVDVTSGIIVGYGVDKKGNRHVYHPGTDVAVPGLKIPRYAELLALVDKLCRVDNKARLVGWDIAITPTGFDLVEMNCPAGHDFLQSFGRPFNHIINKLW